MSTCRSLHFATTLRGRSLGDKPLRARTTRDAAMESHSCAKKRARMGHPSVVERDGSGNQTPWDNRRGTQQNYLRAFINVCPSLLDARGIATPAARMYRATPHTVAGCTLRLDRKS